MKESLQRRNEPPCMFQLFYEDLHLLIPDDEVTVAFPSDPIGQHSLEKLRELFSQNEDDLRPFYITAINKAAAENWHIFALKGRTEKKTSHRMLKIQHICLDLLVSEAVSNLSPSVVDSASSALKRHLGKCVHGCTKARVFAQTDTTERKCQTLIYLLTRTRTLDIIFFYQSRF